VAGAAEVIAAECTAHDGVVRLAERLDDTVGLSAFRSNMLPWWCVQDV
jgi:hypothetical protein